MKAHLPSVALIAACSNYSVNAFTVSPPPQAILVSAPTLALETRVSNLPSEQDLVTRASTTTFLSETTVAAPTKANVVPTPTKANVTPTSSSSAPLNAEALSISDLQYDGQVPTTESDEYVVITNRSKNPMNVAGYFLYVASNGTQGATFTFPANAVIAPGASVRVYTNEIHKETGGYSFGSKKAIWNNKGGLAVLKDASGKKLGEYKYKP